MSKVIGNFTKEKNGQFVGSIQTLNFKQSVRMIPKSKDAKKNAPDLRIMVQDYELGAAWQRESKDGNTYWLVKIDDPSLPVALSARLLQLKDDSGFILIWSRD